jgi:hypothetical protein
LSRLVCKSRIPPVPPVFRLGPAFTVFGIGCSFQTCGNVMESLPEVFRDFQRISKRALTHF